MKKSSKRVLTLESLESRHLLANWYASPVGTGTDCFQTNPCAAEFAIQATGKIKPDDTVHLADGTYDNGPFRVRVNGVTFKAESIGGAIFDLWDENIDKRVFENIGVNNTFFGVRWTSSSPLPRIDVIGTPWPTSPGAASGRFASLGAGAVFIHCEWDKIQGAGADGRGTSVYYSLLHDMGWKGTDRLHGHGWYGQNFGTTTNVVGNFIYDNAGAGIHIFGQQGRIEDWYIEGNTIFQNGGAAWSLPPDHREVLIGGEQAVRNMIFADNNAFNSDIGAKVDFGYPWGGALNGPGEARDNVAGQYRELGAWQNFTKTNNLLISQLTAPNISIEASPYVEDYAHLTIFNPTSQATVLVDLSGVVEVGDHVEIRHVYERHTTVFSGEYTGQAIAMPMRDVRSTPKIGFTPGTLPKKFGAFIVTTEDSGEVTVAPTPTDPPPVIPPADPPPPPDPDPTPVPPPPPPVSSETGVVKEVVAGGKTFTLYSNHTLAITGLNFRWQHIQDFTVVNGKLYIKTTTGQMFEMNRAFTNHERQISSFPTGGDDPVPVVPPPVVNPPPNPPPVTTPAGVIIRDIGQYRFTLHPYSSRMDNLVVTRISDGAHVYTYWHVKDFAFNVATGHFYRLNTDGVLRRSFVTGGSEMIVDKGVKAFELLADGTLKITK